MTIRSVLCLLCCLLLPALVRADPGAGTAARLRSVKADFVQEKNLPILARPLLSRGVFAFQAPQSLRWEYLSPLHTLLLMHDGKMQKLIERDGRLEPDNGAGVDSMRIVLHDMGSWLDGRFADNPVFAVTRSGDRTVVLTPKEQGLQSIISRIELRLGREEGVMESVTIFEGPDAFTRLTFTHAVLNREIPEGYFTGP